VGLLYIAYVTKTIGCPTLLSCVNFIGLLIEDNETRHVRERYTICAAVSSVLCGKKLTSLLFVVKTINTTCYNSFSNSTVCPKLRVYVLL
jgi:hypothetical protein